MSNKENVRMVLSLVLIVLAVVFAGRVFLGPGVLAQATVTPTGTLTTTVTEVATTAATGSPTIEATTEVTGTATTAATGTATTTVTGTATTTATTVATTSPTTVATVVRPTPARTVVQPTLPATRTITFSGVVEMPPAIPTGEMARTITVVGEGRARVTPDTVMTVVGVETISDTVRLATDENAQIMNAVMTAIRNQGVAQADIQTTGFTVFTERQPGQQAGQPDRVLYHVMNNVSITVRQVNDLSNILDAAITAGANSISGVNFSIGDSAPLMVQAREAAVADALARATNLAELTGVQLGPVIRINENVAPGAIPFAVRQDLGGGGAGPISPGQVEVVDQVEVTYAIQ